MTVPVFPVVPTVQQYDWGKIGLQSKVAQFADAAGFKVDAKAPYAELWMGTHPKSPSLLLDSKVTLSEHLAANPSLIGDEIINIYDAGNGNLPFLLKILAIEKALSIQTHPDKTMAERLHKESPDIYKDPNHKPEMAIALTPFSALCGFLPLPKIATYVASTPEFASLIPATIISEFRGIAASRTPTGQHEKAVLRDLFSALMTAEEEKYKTELAKLVKRYNEENEKEEEKSVKDLVIRLNQQFPGDIGVFCVFVLNYVKMEPGEAIFLGAGEPHAYVTGDIVECMATSDNVVRAGLTPKLRDIPNLISGLTYIAADPSKHTVTPQQYHGVSTETTMLYDPPIPEFSVLRVLLAQAGCVEHPAIRGPSLLIVTAGEGKLTWGTQEADEVVDLSTGRVYFVGANTRVTFSTKQGLEVHRAFVEP